MISAEGIAQMNRELAMKRDDVEWIRDATGSLRIVDRQDWSDRRTRQMAEERERERQRYNWRQQHPITEEREAAE